MNKKDVALAVLVTALLNELFFLAGYPSVNIHSVVVWLLILADVEALYGRYQKDGVASILASVFLLIFAVGGFIVIAGVCMLVMIIA